MSDSSANLDLPFIMPSQAQKHVTHNAALERLDAVVQLRLSGVGAVTPPDVPAAGEIHALGTGPTGAWAGQDNRLALWNGTAWEFFAPQPGWRGWDLAAQRLLVWDGTDWAPVRPPLDNLDRLGIGTAADALNRLAVASEATLLSHAGADHRLKINKAATGDTASLLFQSGFTGHAEMGLAGGTDWSVKVSPDGNSWTEALTVAAATGLISGAGVQSSPADATAGRLLRTGAFGLGATDLGAVRLDDGQADLPSGFYSGGGATALPGTFPDTSSEFSPFLNLTRRVSAGAFNQWRLYLSAAAPQLWQKPNGGTWQAVHALVSRQNLLGTVSQSAGVPTGAVIERGSNANGDYVRLADGTQIAWIAGLQTAANAGVDWTWPASFNVSAGVAGVVHQEPASTYSRVWLSFEGPAKFAVRSADGTGDQSVTPRCSIVATGRWF